MSNPLRVYIAGPYSGGDVAVNVFRAMQAWNALYDAGYAPFLPHLTHFIHIFAPRHYEEWLRYDLQWLPLCDVVVRLDGESKGADREEKEAGRLGIPVVHGLVDLFRRFPVEASAAQEQPPDAPDPAPEDGQNRYVARAMAWAKQLDQIHRERGAIYGDVVENHKGIAMMFAPILQVHWEKIRDMVPLPPWAITLLIKLIKCNRARLVAHEDNFVDDLLYGAFTYEMQTQEEGKP